MIKGLDLFRIRFEEYNDQFVLIGGSACWVLMNKAGLPFRLTKDLDVVLIVEALTLDFTKAFCKFIKDGEYSTKQKSNGKPCFYRFIKPKQPNYPIMIEILSKTNNAMSDHLPGQISRMSVAEETISISAIVMNEELYSFLKINAIIVDGLPIADEICLIPLKIRAWIDLSQKKILGVKVKDGDITKHKNDVYRLSQLLILRSIKGVPESIKKDVAYFIENCPDQDDKLKELGIENITIAEMMSRLKQIYLNE